jgi:DNA-directed RNA polymerase subunit RPC12/RpoP
MKQQPRFDIDLDRHYNATLVVACNDCGHENRLNLKALSPDAAVRCRCGSPIVMTAHAMIKARARVDQIKQAYRV